MTEDEIRKLFSRNIKAYRENLGFSQQTLANKAELTPNFINDIENGKKWISPSTLSKISEVLDIQPYKLFIEIDFNKNNCPEIFTQFCTELFNDFLQTMKDLSNKYTLIFCFNKKTKNIFTDFCLIKIYCKSNLREIPKSENENITILTTETFSLK